MKNYLLFITILLSVVSGFIVLKVTNNYFFWIVSVIIFTIIYGILLRLLIKLFKG